MEQEGEFWRLWLCLLPKESFEVTIVSIVSIPESASTISIVDRGHHLEYVARLLALLIAVSTIIICAPSHP